MTDSIVPIHVDTLCSLPEAMESAAIIQNPLNDNETLIFGARGTHNIYIYNHTTDEFTRNKNDDLTTILLTRTEQWFEITSVYAIKGLTERLIIVLGTTRDSSNVLFNFRYPFYSLFDSKSLSFVKIGSKLFNNDKIGTSEQLKNEKAIYNIDSNNTIATYHLPSMNRDVFSAAKYLPFGSSQSRFNTCKNYLLFTQKSILGVYDISDEYNPMLLMYANLSDKVEVAFHGSVLLPCRMSDDNNNNNNVKLLLFGGIGGKVTFLTSFFQYEINFDEIESQLKEKKIEILTNVIDNSNDNSDTDHDDEILSNIIKQTKNDSLSESLNLRGLKVAAKQVKFRLKGRYSIWEYTSNLYNSRHLMIYGLFKPSIPSSGLNIMINFDFQRKKWTIVNDVWPIYDGFCFKGHTIIRSKYNGNWLETIGGLITPALPGRHRNHPTKSHFRLKLYQNIDWSIERLLWIAYLKNKNDNDNNVKQSSCLLSTLPKDIILSILKFLRKGFVFGA